VPPAPLPDLHEMILEACAAGGWAVTTYKGAGSAEDCAWRYAGVVAVRRDLRAQTEWVCETFGGTTGRWLTGYMELAVRHPSHDPADFARTVPHRWRRPATADRDRRCPVPAALSMVRLLGRYDGALIGAVLERAGEERKVAGGAKAAYIGEVLVTATGEEGPVPDENPAQEAAVPGAVATAERSPDPAAGRMAPRLIGLHPDTEDADHAASRLRLAYAEGGMTITVFREALEAVAGGDAGEIARVTDGLPQLPPPSQPGGTHRSYPVDLDLLARLAAITDPQERCVAAAKAADEAAAAQETARQLRMRAQVSAHVRYGVSQVSCYMPYGGISARRPYRTAVRQAPANLIDFGSAEASIAEADRRHGEYEAARSTAETGRLVRNREIHALTDGDYGLRVPNADLARRMGYSTARIAQIRTSRDAA
jgi:hypothetical protein